MRDLTEAMGIGGTEPLQRLWRQAWVFEAFASPRYAERSMRERIARLEAAHRPKEAIAAFVTEIIDRSLKDPDRKGCLLVNTALDVAPHDAEVGRMVGGYLGEIRAFFRRNIEAARARRARCRAGPTPKRCRAICWA